jgi:hypothetical protein
MRPGDDDLLVALAFCVPVGPGQLSRGVDGIGAAAGREEDLGICERGEPGYPPGQCLGGLVGKRVERLIASSARPCPALQYQRLASASRYGRPAASKTVAPSPRTIVTARSAKLAMFANEFHIAGWRAVPPGPVTIDMPFCLDSVLANLRPDSTSAMAGQAATSAGAQPLAGSGLEFVPARRGRAAA